jgi:hypothetical protein
MNTRELIEALQKEDPTGECEVIVGGRPIYFVEKLEGYYDGCYQKLITDESKKPYYCVEGIEFLDSGYKLCLHTLGFTDVLWTNPEAIMDTSKLRSAHSKESYDQCIAKTRKDVNEFGDKLDREFFAKVVARLDNEEWKVVVFNKKDVPDKRQPAAFYMLDGEDPTQLKEKCDEMVFPCKLNDERRLRIGEYEALMKRINEKAKNIVMIEEADDYKIYEI